MKAGLFCVMAALVTACGDDGHVVGDMASGGTSGAPSASTNDASSTGRAASNGSDSSASSNATTSGSGGTPSSTTSSTSATGGGSTTSDAGTGGSAGNATTGSGGGAGTGGDCAAGEMWCPGCYPDEGFCGVVCPGSACLDCSEVQSEADCDARIDCHSVYQDPGLCGCGTPGCCAQFSSCAPGGAADCEGPATSCAMQGPFCEAPAFVVSYTTGCFEGCVKPEDCAGGAQVCPCADCAQGEEMCLQSDACVLATGPTGNALCRGEDGACAYCKCTSPDTLIATPDGNREIRDLRVGDLVYSVHEQSIRLAPIKRINRVPAVNHHVLRVEFESGARFEMSALHPTADGKPLSALGVGDELMGQRILRITRIPYQHSHTYDILPDSDTGTYFADGVLMGSTLAGY